MNQSTENRFIQLDLLRIFSAFCVVLLHASAHIFCNTPAVSGSWLIANAYNIFSRVSVPIFVMISGSLFLAPDKETDIRKLYLSHIFRMFFLYLEWSVFYTILSDFSNNHALGSLKSYLKRLFPGRYHLWFLPMIICIYMLLPLLRRLVHSATRKDLHYFFALFFVFQILVRTGRAFTDHPVINEFFNLFDVELVCSYIGYFVLGYYLSHIGISETLKKRIWIAFPFCYLINNLLSILLNRQSGSPSGEVFDSFGLFTFISVIAVYTFAISHKRSIKKERFWTELSKSTLGVYLMHLAILESPIFMGFLYQVHPLISIPLVSAGVFLTSLALSACLRHIPVIGRFLC